jgi:hypothetical protein
MRILSFFPAREQPYEQQVIQFETEAGLKIPPLYKLFIENYAIEDLSLPHYLIPSNNTLASFEQCKFLLNDSVGLHKLLTLKEILPSMKAIYPPKDKIWKKHLIMIADCAFQNSLMVGTGPTNEDKIYIESLSNRKRITYVCDNIFTFFRNYKVNVFPEFLYPHKLSDLYKNWGEDFWRIRENENPPKTGGIL